MSPFAVAALLPVAVFIFVCGPPIVPSTVYVSPTPVAVVTVSGFSDDAVRQIRRAPFKPRFKLTETSGKSGATIARRCVAQPVPSPIRTLALWRQQSGGRIRPRKPFIGSIRDRLEILCPPRHGGMSHEGYFSVSGHSGYRQR
jgi:hypothetical protein